MLNKILIILVIILLSTTGYFWRKSQKVQPLGSDAYDQELKCLSWSTYSPTTKSWHWRAETFEEYFPSKEDAVENCIVTLSVARGN